tara:strand:+ start:5218 stop:5601 length:384 start_codon:yes stop_codon:yes gene_type:complete
MTSSHRGDKLALGMLILSSSFTVELRERSNKCGYILVATGLVGANRTEPTKQLIHEYLIRQGIKSDKKGRVKEAESLLKLVELLEPWKDFVRQPYPYEAVRHLCLHPPSYDDVDAFREYVAHVDSIL